MSWRDRETALKILDGLRELGVPDSKIVEYILVDHMSGLNALGVMVDAAAEFGLDSPLGPDDDDEEYVHWTFV
jgi:spore maturation protein SpmB